MPTSLHAMPCRLFLNNTEQFPLHTLSCWNVGHHCRFFNTDKCLSESMPSRHMGHHHWRQFPSQCLCWALPLRVVGQRAWRDVAITGVPKHLSPRNHEHQRRIYVLSSLHSVCAWNVRGHNWELRLPSLRGWIVLWDHWVEHLFLVRRRHHSSQQRPECVHAVHCRQVCCIEWHVSMPAMPCQLLFGRSWRNSVHFVPCWDECHSVGLYSVPQLYLAHQRKLCVPVRLGVQRWLLHYI